MLPETLILSRSPPDAHIPPQMPEHISKLGHLGFQRSTCIPAEGNQAHAPSPSPKEARFHEIFLLPGYQATPASRRPKPMHQAPLG